MKVGKGFISTGFVKGKRTWWHVLVSVGVRWKFYFIKPPGKPSYRRLYVGPFELEWSRSPRTL
jgi:hypothetical protein